MQRRVVHDRRRDTGRRASHELQQLLPGLTRGEGVLECAFGGYQPVRGDIPSRSRTDINPLNRKEYLLNLRRRT